MEGHVPNVDENQPDSTSSLRAVASTSQSETAANASASSVFLRPDPKIATRVSEDINDHFPGCSYLRWHFTHRESLWKTDDVSKHILEYTLRTRGRNKLAGIMDQVQEEIREVVSRPVVQRYLEGSRATYESFKDVVLKNCICPQARKTVIGVQQGMLSTVSSGTTQPEPAKGSTGCQNDELNLSEPEDEIEGNEGQDDTESSISLSPTTVVNVDIQCEDVARKKARLGETDEQENTMRVEADDELDEKDDETAVNGSPESQPDAYDCLGKNPLDEAESDTGANEMEGDTDKENVEMDVDGFNVTETAQRDQREQDVVAGDTSKKIIFSECGLDLSDEDELDYEYDED